MSGKKIKLTDAIVDDIAFYLGREYLIPGRPEITTYPPRAETMDAWRIVSAVLSHPDAAGLFATEDDRPWEPLKKGDPLHVGDEVRQDHGGITRTAVVGRAGRVDGKGDPWTAEGTFIGVLSTGTWYVRRAAQGLPTEDGAIIVSAEGREFIEARVHNKTYRAREAVRHWAGGWHAAWRSGPEVRGVVAPEEIATGTWKTADDPR